MGIWTSAFLCAFWRLTWLPLVCMARLIWIHTHHVSCTSESSLSPSWLGWSLRVWGGGSRVAAGCFVCSWVSGYPPCTALLLPGHVSHRLSLLFTFLMRGAVLCDMWLTAMQPPTPTPPNYPSLGFLAEMCCDREGGALCLVVSFCSLSPLPSVVQRGFWELWHTHIPVSQLWVVWWLSCLVSVCWYPELPLLAKWNLHMHVTHLSVIKTFDP